MTPITLAVILAAGLGTRISATVQDCHKGLLPLADKTLTARSLDQLRNHGIERVIIVTGHLAEQYEQLAATRRDVTTIHNPAYAISGSMYSLYCARHLVAGEPFLLLECDLVYEDRALSALLTFPRSHAILVSALTGSGDEALVMTAGDRVTKVTKAREHLPNALGEQVGITKVSPAMMTAMCHYAERYFAQVDRKLEYYSGALNGIMNDFPIHYCYVPDLLWSEVDDEAQWRYAKEEIYPQIQRLELGRYALPVAPDELRLAHR